jgi:hypothetical protein
MPVTTVITPYNTSVGPLFFDGKLREEHKYVARVTSNPLEFGANAVDHAYMEPQIVTLDVIVGDIWTGFTPAVDYNLFERASDALSQLRQLQVDREPLLVVSNLARYDKLFLREIEVTQDKDTSSTLIALLTFQEAIIVDDQQQNLPVNNDSTQHQTPTNTGNKQLQPGDDT